MSWEERAAVRVEAAFAGLRWWPWRRGLWATARPDYGPRAHDEGVTIDAGGVPRRLAFRAGRRGPPLLILPGLYATLDEGLFADLFCRAAESDRAVALLEDRLAAPTLAATGGSIVGLVRQGEELAAVARWIGEVPDVLALSAGVAVALAAPPGTWRRLAGWSGVLDAGAVARVRAHPVLGPYYRRVHRCAFARAGLPPPPVEGVWEALQADPVPSPGDRSVLLVHAADDPVVPIATARASVPPGAPARLVVIRGGGHLGFGAVAGDHVYLRPFEEEP